MSDTSNPYAAGFFFANEPGVNLKMREKIALAQMMQKNKAPQNIGEGIFSIGDSISDALMARNLMQQDKDAQMVALKAGGPPQDASEITPTAAPPSAVSSAPVAPAPPALAPPIQAPRPPAPGNLPPTGAPGNTGATSFAPVPPSVPGGQQATAMEPPPASTPTVPQFADRFNASFPNRNAVTTALLAQQPPPAPAGPAPTALAAPPPGQGIPKAPPMQEQQPQSIAGYVPPEMADPTGAKIIQPSDREKELTAIMAVNAGNPHMTTAPAAKELERLVKARELRQTEQNELFKAGIARATKRDELRQGALIGQAKSEAEVAETRQKLVDYGQTRAPGASDPRLLGTPQSPQRAGIPTPEPMPPGVIPVEWAKDQQKKISATQDAYEAAKPELSEAINLLDNIRTHAGKSRSIGPLGRVGAMTAEGQGFAALNEQLKGKNLVSIYQKIRGTGPVGEREGENLAKAQAALTTAGTEKDYDNALDTLETTLRGAVERTERKLNRPVTAYQKTPDDPYAPDIGQIGTRGGKQVEYIGGDPAKDSSYRTLRR